MGPSPRAGYPALHEGVAWLDLASRGKIIARGEDRARLIHAMTTNDVESLQPGEGCYAFFLNAQGRILGDVNVLCLVDHFLLETEPETAGKLYAHLDKYIIADDVSLDDATAQLEAVGLEGPRAAGILEALGAPAPEASHAHAAWGSRIVARLSVTGAPGFRIFVPAGEKDELVRQLESAGAPAASAEAVRTVRLEHGRPRYGDDITEGNLPQETQLDRALHFSKGCYLGQEIVERIRARGHVHRLLVRLQVETAEAPAPDTPLHVEGNPIGALTSAAFSPLAAQVAALGYVRADCARAGFSLRAGEWAAAITDSRPG